MMSDWILDGAMSWLTDRAIAMLRALMSWLTLTVFTSPDVTVLPQVTTIAGRSAMVVNTCYILAIITAGIVVMASSSVQLRYGVKELVPRLVVAFVLSNFALPLCSQLIQLANALTTAMVGQNAPTTQAASMSLVHLQAASADAGSQLVALVIGLLIVVLMYSLTMSWVIRVAVLVILAGISPVALACYCLPYTQPAAQLWWRSLLGCLGTATLQAISFNLGMQLITDPDANLPVLLGVPGGDLINLLLIATLLWMTVKIPGLMRRYVTRQGSTNTAGVVLRAVLIQSVTRKLPLGHTGRVATRAISRGVR